MTLLLWVLLAQPAPSRAEGATPGVTWEERAPAEAGLSLQKLDALRDLAGGRGCVVRAGRLVYAWGDASKPGDVASAVKPVISTLLLLAVTEGRLAGIDARVSEVEPRLIGKNAAITWKHLAGQLSGYGLGEEPGAAWADNEDALALYSDTLMGKVYARPGTEVLRSRLAGPLQFQDPVGLEASGRLSISPRDFARFGLLILQGGAWDGKQILAPGLTYLSISQPVPADTPASAAGKAIPPPGPGYCSFGWWLNGIDAGRRQLFPDGPGDLVAALGHGGRRALWLLPSRDLVVSWNDADIDDLDGSPGRPEARINRAVRLMAEASKP